MSIEKRFRNNEQMDFFEKLEDPEKPWRFNLFLAVLLTIIMVVVGIVGTAFSNERITFIIGEPSKNAYGLVSCEQEYWESIMDTGTQLGYNAGLAETRAYITVGICEYMEGNIRVEEVIRSYDVTDATETLVRFSLIHGDTVLHQGYTVLVNVLVLDGVPA